MEEPVKAPVVKKTWKAGPKACKECQRLKLKAGLSSHCCGTILSCRVGQQVDPSPLQCSRVFPCSNCIRRGCKPLCPDGTMAPRESLKLARTIKSLIAENESLRKGESSSPDASFSSAASPIASTSQMGSSTPASIQQLDVSPSSSAGPLLERPANLLERPANALESAAGSGGGLLELAGHATFLGRGAGALFFIDGGHSDDPSDIPALVFPFMTADPLLLATLPSQIPTSQEAAYLINIYWSDVAWMYEPTSRECLQEDFGLLYASDDATSCVESLHPHRLAALFSIFALADVFAIQHTAGRGTRSQKSIQFFNTASALLTANPHNFLCQPTLGAVEALHTMVSFLFCLGDRDGAKAAWPILGLCSRTSQAMGLNKDGSKWGSDPRETRERAKVFWETNTYDLLQSLNFGRPYSLPRQFIQAPQPHMTSPISSADAFHSLKFDLGLLFGKVADLLTLPELPAYEQVLQLDQELRSREARAPPWLRLGSGASPHADASTIPQKHMVSLLLHKALLALHRPWFAKALLSGPEPMLSPNAASYNACIISARKHNTLMRSLLAECPTAAYTWWFFLFHTFTAAVIQASVLLRAPDCMLASDVRLDFLMAYDIFAEVAPGSVVARRALPILSRLRLAISPTSDHLSNLGENYAANTSADPAPPAQGVFEDDATPFTTNFDFSDPASFNPAETLLADGRSPAFWDPVGWTDIDSLDHTLLFWNAESILANSANTVTPPSLFPE